MVFEVLNRLKWKDGLEGVEIIILHRGAPGNRKVIRGEELTEIKRSYLVYGITEIPLHRIREVRKDGRTIWKREGKKD
jgi:uncharacterized protein (UPF0248 family)